MYCGGVNWPGRSQSTFTVLQWGCPGIAAQRNPTAPGVNAPLNMQCFQDIVVYSM